MIRTAWVLINVTVWFATVSLTVPAAGSEPTAWAFIGKPFGVGRLTIPLNPAEDSFPVNVCGYSIIEQNDRVYYPAFAEQRVLGVLRRILGVSSTRAPNSATCFFLFTGSEPLQITVFAPAPRHVTIQPQRSQPDYDKLLQGWWRQYAAVSELQVRASDYPPLLEKYLTNTLAKRLGLQVGQSSRTIDRPLSLEWESLLLMFNCEAMRIRSLEQTLQAKDRASPEARVALPAPVAWPVAPSDAPNPLPEIEPIARHVPDDCFYIRFGSFPNYLWFDRWLSQFGGSVQQMVTLRGHTVDLTGRAERQLGLSKTVLAQLLGEKLISDMVIFGRDAYVREGAALGVLFEAKNELLANELMNLRRQAVNREKRRGAEFLELSMDGRTISFAISPDNYLRSLYLADGAYHLVTNSVTIARQFLRAGQGQRVLADLPSFQQARAAFPLRDEAALFSFLSVEFLHGLMTPQYQIELRRRLRAVTDLELVQLARRAARHEGQSAETIEQLVAGQFLPRAIQRRADSSHVVCQGDQVVDSLRGVRGSFLPIPDVPIDDVTVSEVATWRQLVETQQRRWNLNESLAMQLQRRPVASNGHERVTVRAALWPYNPKKYGTLIDRLGPPTTRYVRHLPEDAASLQVVLRRADRPSERGSLHVCLGMQDREVPVVFSTQRLLRGLQILRTAPVYIGIWPAIDVADLAPLLEIPPRDDRGRTRLPFGLWYTNNREGFTLLAVDETILDEAVPRLALEQDEHAAVARLRIGNLAESHVRNWFARLDYQRATRIRSATRDYYMRSANNWASRRRRHSLRPKHCSMCS